MLLGRLQQQQHPTPTTFRKMAGKFLPPSSVKGMQALDKAAFSCSFVVSALRVDAKNCNKARKALSRILLRRPRFKDIVSDQTNAKKKLLLLDSILSNIEDLKADEQMCIKENNGELTQHQIICTYDHFTADEILDAVLPDGMEVTTAFETVGHIAHMNLRECHLQFKELIGTVIFDKNPNIRTVVNKTNTIEETFRFFKMELLAGENDTFAHVKQHGCKFEFDFSKVYWNSRLQTEHQRIVGILDQNDVVCDVFAGVGPFAIPAAKKGCFVYANDLNPESYKALLHNIKINKVLNKVVAYNLDGREFLKKVLGKGLLEQQTMQDANQTKNITHIIMNLPAIAIEFLDVFKDVDTLACRIANGLTVHCYCFSKMENPFQDVEGRVRQILGSKVGDCKVHMVRNVAPKKVMMCISFHLTCFNCKDKVEPKGTDHSTDKRGTKRPAED